MVGGRDAGHQQGAGLLGERFLDEASGEGRRRDDQMVAEVAEAILAGGDAEDRRSDRFGQGAIPADESAYRCRGRHDVLSAGKP